MPLTNTKYLELLVVGDMDNANSPVDLEGWIIDNNSNAIETDSFVYGIRKLS